MKKISIFIIIFFWLFGNIFADNAILETEKLEIVTGESFFVVLTLDSNWKFVELKWAENFQILSQSQSSFNSSSISIVNGEKKEDSKIVYKIILTLSPISAWEFELWPAVFETSNWTISSNVVQIKVSWESVKNEYIPESKRGFLFSFLWNPIIIIFFIFFLWLLWYWYSLFQNNKKVFAVKTPVIPKKEIIFPEIDDENFSDLLYKIFIEYLEKKFYGTDFYYKTLSEIGSGIDKKEYSEIHEIIWLFQKVKYSAEKLEKEELVERMRKIIKNTY